MTRSIRLSDVWTVPGCLSLSRIAFAVAFPFSLEAPRVALALVAAAALSDFLDGWYARRFGMTSPTGALLDPITDKCFAISVLVSLVAAGKLTIGHALLLNLRELGELPILVWLWCTPRARALRARDFGSNLLGKLTTALQFGALIAILLEHSGERFWIAATAGVGAVAAFSYFLKFRAALQGEPARPEQRGDAAAAGPS